MKKLLFTLSISLIALTCAVAQQMPNASFEVFETYSYFGVLEYNAPKGFAFCSNIICSSNQVDDNVTQVAGNGGGKALQMRTVETGTDTTFGYAITFKEDFSEQGFPYSAMPEFIEGDYKLDLPGGKDTAVIQMILTRYDENQQGAATIGFASKEFSLAKSAFGKFTIPITYFDVDLDGDGMADKPDTCIIYLIGGSGNVIGTTFTLDNLAFRGDGITAKVKSTTPVEELMGLSHFPNPVKEALTIKYTVTKTKPVTITILDVTGKLVQSVNEGILTENDYQAVINTSALANGVYTYTVAIGDNKMSRKFVVAGK